MIPSLRRVLLVKPAERLRADTSDDPLGMTGFPPLELATVAALTPDDVDVHIWDERVRGRITASTRFSTDYDLVGVTAYLGDRERAKELGDLFRGRRIFVVVGGVGVSSAPELFRGHFDVLFIGEAEYTWPQFIADVKSGCPRTQYRQVTKVDLADSPAPKWDSIAGAMRRYAMGSVQTTRGCPFDCEFCDVIYLFGRRPRRKPIQRVVEEVRALGQLGFRRIFFSDDNLYGDPRHARGLLRELAALNRTLPHPLAFGTQLSLNIAEDEEFLSLAAEANLDLMFIGIESVNQESLKQANKLQNCRLDLVEAVKKIQSYGPTVLGSMIVGFDQDDASIFQRQFEFLQNACLPAVNIRVLSALPGTRLWVRLHKEGRVLEDFRLKDATGYLTRWAVTNALPKNMSLTELLVGYRDLVKKVFAWENYETRLKGMLSLVRPGAEPPRRRATLRSILQLPRTLWAVAAGGWLLVSKKPARQALLRFLADRQARHAMRHCLPLARRRGPSCVKGTLFQLWLQHLAVRYEVPKMIEEIDEELRRIGDPDRLPRDKTMFVVPDAFREAYRQILPQLHERVHGQLLDKSRTEGALVDVIHDFLARWGATLEQFEDHHRQFLWETCAQAIARENGMAPARQDASDEQDGAPQLPSDGQGESARHMQALADEVLRSVEEEFRTVRRLPLPA